MVSVPEEVPLHPGEAGMPEGAVVPGSSSMGASSMGGAAPGGMRKPVSSQIFSSEMGQENSDGARGVQLLSFISSFVPGEPQVITLHLGGQCHRVALKSGHRVPSLG